MISSSSASLRLSGRGIGESGVGGKLRLSDDAREGGKLLVGLDGDGDPAVDAPALVDVVGRHELVGVALSTGAAPVHLVVEQAPRR